MTLEGDESAQSAVGHGKRAPDWVNESAQEEQTATALFTSRPPILLLCVNHSLRWFVS